jgi:hypothetical protein
MIKPLEEAWKAYLKKCVSPKAGEYQISETEHAFMAGASVVFSHISAIANNPSEETMEPETEILSRMGEEINDYYKNIKLELARHTAEMARRN